jgi:hypothetical protein
MDRSAIRTKLLGIPICEPSAAGDGARAEDQYVGKEADAIGIW